MCNQGKPCSFTKYNTLIYEQNVMSYYIEITKSLLLSRALLLSHLMPFMLSEGKYEIMGIRQTKK
jgi:hypothetical protein